MNVNKTIFKALVALLVIMLGVNFNAEAQLGGLLNKAKERVAGGGAKKNTQEIEALIEQTKAFVPKPGQTPNATITMDGTEVASWDGAKNELTLKTDNGGFTSGTVLKVDGNTGKITDASGKAMGSLNTKSVESPNLGVIDLVEQEAYYTVEASNDGSIKRLRRYRMEIQKQAVFGQNRGYELPIRTTQKEGKGYTFFVESDQDVKFKFANRYFVVSDKLVGAALPIYVASLMLTQEEYNREMVNDMLGFDASKTYTTKELEDLIRWKDDDTEAEIKKIEEGKTYSDDRVKGAKIAKIGLKGEWQRSSWEKNYGPLYERNYYVDEINYWVVYELPNGKNKVAFYSIVKNKENKGLTERGKCTGFHDVTDWVRK